MSWWLPLDAATVAIVAVTWWRVRRVWARVDGPNREPARVVIAPAAPFRPSADRIEVHDGEGGLVRISPAQYVELVNADAKTRAELRRKWRLELNPPSAFGPPA